jgi:hypothetical protein
MSLANCCVLLKDTFFNYNQYEENNDGSQLLQLPREVISIIGRFVAQDPNGIRDASQWGSVCVLTHQLWHNDQEDCQALETIWKKMPSWCCFIEHIDQPKQWESDVGLKILDMITKGQKSRHFIFRSLI